MYVGVMRGEVGRRFHRILRRAVSVVPLFTAALLMTSSAAQAVVDPTPTPKTPPHTETDAATKVSSSTRALDGQRELLFLAQQSVGERQAAADDAAPRH